MHARRISHSQQRLVLVLSQHERPRKSAEEVSLRAEQKLHLCVCSANHRSGDFARDEQTDSAFHGSSAARHCAYFHTSASFYSDLCSAHCLRPACHSSAFFPAQSARDLIGMVAFGGGYAAASVSLAERFGRGDFCKSPSSCLERLARPHKRHDHERDKLCLGF